jgi:hypothetical protein
MQPTSIFCRAQEARQHALATGTGLLNVRGIATLAAAAWAKEAVAAEKREERVDRKQRASRAGMLCAEPLLQEDRSLSENPDRAFAEASQPRTGDKVLRARLRVLS